MTMIRERQAPLFDAWLTAAESCGVRELRQFAKGLRRDYTAVKAALTVP
jgi:transposase